MSHINTFNFVNKKALVRVDFNVSFDSDMNITDDTRIRESIPTIQKLLSWGASVILMTHLWRPQKREWNFSTKHIVSRLQHYLGDRVEYVSDCIWSEVESRVESLQEGQVLLLENLRYYSEESKWDEDFAKRLSHLWDVYINDAFWVSHREHASTYGVAKYFRDKMLGILMEKEVSNIRKLLDEPVWPFTWIVGGAKVSSKIDTIVNLVSKVNHLIIGGGMSYTFTKALGWEIGNSLVEDDKLDVAREVLEIAKKKDVCIHLPEDSFIAQHCSNTSPKKLSVSNNIQSWWMGLDIGVKSKEKFSRVIWESKTIFWNGPMGVFEFENFSGGTKGVAESIVKATEKGAFSLVGGGDSIAAANMFGISDKVSYISTGGWALLRMIEGKGLPGVDAIEGK